MFIEVSNDEIRKAGGVKKAIQAGGFNVWTEKRIKGAFRSGCGTVQDLRRYYHDNVMKCTILDLPEAEVYALYPLLIIPADFV